MQNQTPHLRFPVSFSFLLVTLAAVQGCTVIAIADTVGTVAVKTVGLAADAAIGVVKISGKAVGAAADAVIPENK